MQIKNIKLKNIRSYLDEHITLPEGTVLLAGDIGSGKSTILYAIDFALFGITKDLNGSSLLRHGAKEGSVELHFEVDGKDVIIERRLKRGSSVTQDYGILNMDGVKRELTAVELKQKILELLHYPQELLTKKSLIYRYTVYTPQDEMKSILLADDHDRVDTLRRVFGIDKYKRISDHAEQFLKQVRVRIRSLQDSLAEQGQKEDELKQLIVHLQALSTDIAKLTPQLTTLQKNIQDMKQHITLQEKDLMLYQEQHKELKVVETSLAHYARDIEYSQQHIPLLEREIAQLERDVKQPQQIDAIQLQRLDEKIQRSEEKLRTLLDQTQECSVHIKTSHEHVSSLTSLDICPLCDQKVPTSHLEAIKQKEQDKIMLYQQKTLLLQEEEKALRNVLETLKREREQVSKALHEQTLLAFQKKTLDEKKLRLQDHQKMLTTAQQQWQEAGRKQQALHERMKGFTQLDQKITHLRTQLDALQEEERQFLMEKAALEKEKSVLERDVQKIEALCLALKKKEHTVQELLRFHAWMGDCFVGTMGVLEKNIMLKVHRDFDQLFQKWFGMLVETELMRIRLDDSFSPVIEQNGYETDYGFLSGGEKTAAALAYRLALNQVITTIMGVIKTRDLLILDEPTDGFSEQQLDRMRDLLDELDAKQIILVSHEDKIESFVDTVIRVEKHNHVSRVIS